MCDQAAEQFGQLITTQLVDFLQLLKNCNHFNFVRLIPSPIMPLKPTVPQLSLSPQSPGPKSGKNG